MILSLCGCESPSKRNEKAQELTASLAQAVYTGDTAALMAFIDDPEVTEEYLKQVMNPPDLNREQEAFLQEVKASTSYVVDHAIYDKELNMVMVTVFWTQADIYAEAVQTAETMADLKTAIAEAPARIITTIAEVDLSGETPRIRDPTLP